MATNSKAGAGTSKGAGKADKKDTRDQDAGAVEITEATADTVELTHDTAAELPHHSFFDRLYTGTGAFEVVGRRKLWYGVSGAIVAVAILSIILRGFTFGIDFKGGTTVSFPRGKAPQVAQVEDVFRKDRRQ